MIPGQLRWKVATSERRKHSLKLELLLDSVLRMSTPNVSYAGSSSSPGRSTADRQCNSEVPEDSVTVGEESDNLICVIFQ